MLGHGVNLEMTVTLKRRLTWVVTQRTRLEGTSSHPGHPGGHDLRLEPSGFSLFVLINLALKSLDLACPFSETNRIRFGYIVCPSTSCSVHEEGGRRVVRAVADDRRQISHMSRTKKSVARYLPQPTQHIPLLLFVAALSCTLRHIYLLLRAH